MTVSSAFSTDHDNYLIVLSGGVASTQTTAKIKFGSTTTGYYYSYNGWTYPNLTLTGAGSNAADSGVGFECNTNVLDGTLFVANPFTAKVTTWHGESTLASTTGYGYSHRGFLNDTTSYTAFTLTPNAGTLTGGTISVYGYRK